MDILSIYSKYKVPYITEGKSCTTNWVQVKCPFCDDPSEHLGYSLERDYFNCWRCGWHPIVETLSRLLQIKEEEIRKLIKEYDRKSIIPLQKSGTIQEVRLLSFKYPNGTGPIEERHKLYLEMRGFDPEKLEREWGILGTDPMSWLININGKKIDYSNRILAPISWGGEIVSFQTRCIRDDVKPKYKACPKEREIEHHKYILYSQQNISTETGLTGICVEGITDCWRFGKHAFAVFGIQYTQRQISKISQIFDRIAIVFDNDDQAQIQAEKLVSELKLAEKKVKIIKVTSKDPGSMSQTEADYLVKYLIK